MFIGASEGGAVDLSVVIPAHNEEKYIGRCLETIRRAAACCAGTVEALVVLNRCADRTREIAESYGCATIEEDAKNLSVIRNAGVRAARGETIVTIDADSWMSDNMLAEVERLLGTGEYVGGGVGSMRFERVSLGIILSAIAIVIPLAMKYGRISVGMFWFRRADFEAIGGFDERMLMTEDADFAKRLKRRGKSRGLAFGTIRDATLYTSSRKFDQHGDWAVFRNPSIMIGYWTGGRNRKAADLAYYENQRR